MSMVWILFWPAVLFIVIASVSWGVQRLVDGLSKREGEKLRRAARDEWRRRQQDRTP